MFAKLFRRAEASVDNAIGDLGNRVVVAVPFLIAIGFAAASLSLTLNKTYGPEVGNLLVAGVFGTLGLIVALIFKMRNNSKAKAADPAADRSPRLQNATPVRPLSARMRRASSGDATSRPSASMT